jgi:HEAT repeat protein
VLSRSGAVAFALSTALFLGAAPPPAKNVPDPDRVVAETMARAGDIPAQANALVALAWPLDGGDPAVRAKAEAKLVEFGDHGMDALWKALFKVKAADQVDVVKTLLLEFRRLDSGLPPEYLPALDDAIWFGTREARLVAIPEVARFATQGPVLTIIDAAIEDPEILPTAVQALGAMRDGRARFFLERVLHEGKPGIRETAAVALARIGAPGRAVLKTAIRSDSKDIRLIAVRALVAVATVDDLSSLYEYSRAHADDDAAAAAAVESVTVALEKILEAQRALDSATPSPQ